MHRLWEPTKSGFFFCRGCYHKYKDKRLLIEIGNCKDITILDDSYEGSYNCDDGHVVKSKSEMIIDNYLFEKGVSHAYEKDLPIDENANRDLHPDFFLLNLSNDGVDVYIEHWGYNETTLSILNQKNINWQSTRKRKSP